MYLHLGSNCVVSAQDMIAIINLSFLESAEINERIERAREEKRLINISEKGKEKSLIISDKNVYISPISSTTLYKRKFFDIN